MRGLRIGKRESRGFAADLTPASHSSAARLSLVDWGSVTETVAKWVASFVFDSSSDPPPPAGLEVSVFWKSDRMDI